MEEMILSRNHDILRCWNLTIRQLKNWKKSKRPLKKLQLLKGQVTRQPSQKPDCVYYSVFPAERKGEIYVD